jgi:hypothetical protein
MLGSVVDLALPRVKIRISRMFCFALPPNNPNQFTAVCLYLLPATKHSYFSKIHQIIYKGADTVSFLNIK